MVRTLSLLRLEPDSHLLFNRGASAGLGENSPTVDQEGGAKAPIIQTLKITNTSEGNVAWKVRTTAPRAFLVKPRAGIVKGGETAEAIITLLPDFVATVGDFRFEVRAVAVPPERDSIERTDWQDFSSTAVQAARLRAVLSEARGNSVEQQVRASASRSSTVDDVFTPERRRNDGSGFATSQAPTSRRLVGNRDVDERWDEQRRRASNSREAADVGKSSSSVAETGERNKATVLVSDGQQDSDKLPPMSFATKALMGVLICILVFNLYLRPLLGFLRDDGGDGDGDGGDTLQQANAARASAEVP
mmetsp:Transcript_20862/g.52202  ORF Transcript_20862/g.52202 Transcript_20862/m.52202 type:complete len:304 (-) Transcript_20862:37-948(-)